MKKTPLENLMNVTIETIIEAINHEPWFAFVNNGFAITGIAINHKELYANIKDIQANPSALEDMEAIAVQKFGKKLNAQLASIIFRHVWGMIVYNTSSIISMEQQIREYNDSQKEG